MSSQKKPRGVPDEVKAIIDELRRFFDTKDEDGRRIGNAKGVYALFDYDGEPIYVGKTDLGLSGRVRRHLTNQRTDAIAMSVLDPFEVFIVEIWPLTYDRLTQDEKKAFAPKLAAAEFTVYAKVIGESTLKQVLNEKTIPKLPFVELPRSYRHQIVPAEIHRRREHPDLRIARRAQTIARLAQVISEREVSAGLRKALVTQATRLKALAEQRYAGFKGQEEIEAFDEETGETEEQ